VVDVGCDMESSRLSCEHSKAYEWCYGAVGFHPHFAKDYGDTEELLIRSMAKKKGIQAIGEIGLDYHYDRSPREKQREAFRRQIRLAKELKMPIVIHSREADQETMDILKDEGAFSDERKADFPLRKVPEGWESASADARVLLHCFSGSRELGEQYVRLGASISIAGPVTYKNNRKTVGVAERIPIEFLMVETDAPFLTPEPFRGKPNRSSYVVHTARRIAVIKQMEVEDVARITCENAKRFFGIDNR
jgi:TatD DNase family protein